LNWNLIGDLGRKINYNKMSFPILNSDTETTSFKKHLEQENNSSIIFSGIFGIGKTYFIKKFFETNENPIL
jgi:predicted ATPase